MSESRVSQLLRNSRSRHQVVISPDVRQASWEWHTQKARSRQISKNLNKMMSEMRYFESLNKRLTKGVVRKKKDLSQAESVRSRYMNDVRQKEKLEELRQQEIKKNKTIAEKIKNDRNKRLGAVKNNLFQKLGRGDYSRNQKERLKKERQDNQLKQFIKNRSRVEQTIEFECNLRESYIRKKESDNMNFLKNYKQSISSQRKTMQFQAKKAQSIRNRLRVLTEGTARKMSEISQISASIRRYNPRTPHPHLSINKQKLMSKSQRYTYSNNADSERPTTYYTSSLFLSQQQH